MFWVPAKTYSRRGNNLGSIYMSMKSRRDKLSLVSDQSEVDLI